MLISHAKQFVFVHIPKAAGNAITESLAKYADYQQRDANHKHFSAREIRSRFFGDGTWRSFYRFAVIRNPFEQVHSDYYFCKTFSTKRLPPRLSQWKRKLNRIAKQTFTEFVRDNARGRSLAQYYCQDAAGRDLVTDIFRMEDLPGEWPTICDRCGIPKTTIRRVNVTRGRPPIQQDYTRETIEIVSRRYAYDIQRFGYATP